MVRGLGKHPHNLDMLLYSVEPTHLFRLLFAWIWECDLEGAIIVAVLTTLQAPLRH